ncbi:MAG: branched-chain amino acid aminotransferase [Bacteroidales bacterium]|nr:branched-chain amino acid aminotransferase [Bacteroidales bacterium]
MTELDWSKLTFSYTKTNTILISRFDGSRWSEVESSSDDYIRLSAFAGALHYSIECFEGLKAFRGKDGKVRLFRPEENAKRLQRSAKYLGIEAPSTEMFIQMCERSVRENIEFLPPYGSRASLYLRPTLIGSNPQLGVQSSKESTFILLCSPVGAYTGGVLEAIDVVIARNYDRAAPNGTGAFKVGGNYGASLASLNKAHELGFKAVLYLDPATKKYIDEFNSSNFFAIKGNTYITPLSTTILPSITNMSLEVAAADLGMEVERRPVPVEELPTFDEVGECGTAVVITPVHKLVDKPSLESEKETVYTYGDGLCGEKSLQLFNYITDIQYGVREDKFGWTREVEI